LSIAALNEDEGMLTLVYNETINSSGTLAGATVWAWAVNVTKAKKVAINRITVSGQIMKHVLHIIIFFKGPNTLHHLVLFGLTQFFRSRGNVL
jgi:hypothetical protein